MLDTHLADIVKHDPLFQREFPHELTLLGGGNIFIRYKMVGHHHDFLGSKTF